jgi:hypothetical protein
MGVIIARPADPATTTSATLVMMGFGVVFTPNMSGRVLVIAAGQVWTATGQVPMVVAGRYGTGAPPSGGAAVTGSRFSVDQTTRSAGITAGNGITVVDVVSLNAGTSYWFDLAFSTTNASDAATAQNFSVVLWEQS